MAVVIALYIGAMIVFSRPGLFYEARHYYNIGDTSSISVKRADGDVETYRGLVFPSVDVGDRCEVHISLPKAYKFDHAALCFIVYHSVVRIYDGDKLIYSYGGMLERGGDMIGGVSDRIVIPDDAWGRGLTMELRVVENSAFSTSATNSFVSPSSVMPRLSMSFSRLTNPPPGSEKSNFFPSTSQWKSTVYTRP